MKSSSARFLHKTSRSQDAFLLEVVLPGGSITHVFRNVLERRIVLQGAVDRVSWTLDNAAPGDEEIVHDIVEFTIPKAYNFSDVNIIEKFHKGRVLLSFPRKNL
jgi:hypothetical protein